MQRPGRKRSHGSVKRVKGRIWWGVIDGFISAGRVITRWLRRKAVDVEVRELGHGELKNSLGGDGLVHNTLETERSRLGSPMFIMSCVEW